MEKMRRHMVEHVYRARKPKASPLWQCLPGAD